MLRRLSWLPPLILMVIGLLILGSGIAQRTIWQPPATVTAQLDTAALSSGQNAPLTILESKALSQRSGPVQLKISGDGPIFLAQGRADDVEAWVGKTPHLVVDSAKDDFSGLNASFVDGQDPTANPAGSDLWTSEQSSSGELSYDWQSPSDGDWSLLLASDGKAAAPQRISITVPNDDSTPWAIPLMVIGGVLLLLGVLLWLFLARFKRPRKGGSSGRRAAGVAATVIIALGAMTLSQLNPPSASADDSSSASPSSSGSGAPSSDSASEGPDSPLIPVLSDDQFSRVLGLVAKTVASGDAAKNANLLTSRVDGAALQERTANYKIRAAAPSYAGLEAVTDNALKAKFISSARQWPRSVVAVTQGTANKVPQFLTLVQATARDNYKLTATARMLPSQSFQPKDGPAVPLPLDSKADLNDSPAGAMSSFAALMSAPDGNLKSKFADSAYVNDGKQIQTNLIKDNKDAATFSFKRAVKPGSVIAFPTGDGGAVVLGVVDFSIDATTKSNATLEKLDDGTKALAGGDSTQKGYKLSYGEQAVLYLPPAAANKPITVLAAERGLIAASFK
ncbi:hypothetical protein [Psychromicrobium sp. YIM B11713]|uniref:hypothetical protein n=1 Tax=Psychromicrobium sp. YIM B11713 TaxID=3145233 RepID=UPI00374F3D93